VLLQEPRRYYYVAKRIPKRDGRTRVVYGVRDPLRAVHRAIVRNLFWHVDFPEYLMGGIRDPERTRGYARNARTHVGASMMICEDIDSFFPSISMPHVLAVFRDVFSMPPDVANALATLCTRDGELPQGAAPSSYIANAVLSRCEPDLVANLKDQGYRYTRYVDDITISSTSYVAHRDIASVTSAIIGMLTKEGFKAKREKRSIQTARGPMRVHHVNVHERATLPREERKRIRAVVHRLATRARVEPNDVHDREFAVAYGHVATLAQFHPVEAARLRDQLRSARALLPREPRAP
jgi:hypothetical protein